MVIKGKDPFKDYLGELSKRLAKRRGFLKDVSLAEIEPKQKQVVPEGFVFDYATNQFVSATRERVAPPGTPGKVTPEEFEQQQIATLGVQLKSLYPERFQIGLTEEELPQVVLEQISIQIEEDPQAFLVDLYDRATVEEAEEFLGVLAISPLEITSITAQFAEVEIIKTVFPDMDVGETIEFAETDISAFIEKIQLGGRTKEKQDLLRMMGLEWEEINDIFKTQKVVLDIEGVRQLVTFSPDGKAYNEKGQWVGTYNRATQQFNAAKNDEGWFKDNIIDPWNMAANRLGQSLTQFGSGALANILFRDLGDLERKIYGDDWVDSVNAGNKELRDGFRLVHSLNQKDFDDWIVKHSELIPKPEYEEGLSEHPELLFDPGYFAYEFSSTAPISLGIMAIMAGGYVTGNIPFAIAASMAIMTPAEGADAYDALLDAGAPEDQAAPWALLIGSSAGLIETFSDLLFLKVIAAPIAGLFRKAAVEGMAKATVGHLIKKGAFNYTATTAIEVAEEVLTLAISNSVLKIYDENKEIWDDMVRTAAKTFAAVAPIAGITGVSTAVGLSRQQASQVSPDILNKVKESLRIAAEEVKVRPERGAIGKPEEGRPEEVTPPAVEKVRAEAVPAVVEGLPEGWQMGIGRTRTKEGHTAEAEIDWENKRIVFRDKESMVNPEIVNHEIAHVRFEELPDDIKGKLLDKYADLKEPEWKAKGWDKEWVVKNQLHHEVIIIDRTQYLTDASKLKPEIKAFFDMELPIAKPLAVEEVGAVTRLAKPTGLTSLSWGTYLKDKSPQLLKAVRLVGLPDEVAARSWLNLSEAEKDALERLPFDWVTKPTPELAIPTKEAIAPLTPVVEPVVAPVEVIPTELQSLAEEAQKFKSAEEFAESVLDTTKSKFVSSPERAMGFVLDNVPNREITFTGFSEIPYEIGRKIIYYEKGKPVAGAIVQKMPAWDKEKIIHTLVLPEQQRQGLGAKLYRELANQGITESYGKATEGAFKARLKALTGSSSLTDFYNQAIKGIAPEAVEAPVSTIGEEGVIIAEGGVPVSPTEVIPQGIVDNSPILQDIGAKEKTRAVRKVLTRIGLWRELYKPIQKSEIEFNEELEEKRKQVRELRKLAGKDKSRWVLIFREANEAGSQVGLTFNEKRVVAKIRKWADDWANRKGLSQERRIKDYIPHLFEEEIKRELNTEAGIDPLVASILREKSAFPITDPFLKERLGALGFIEDPFAAMEAYDTVSLRALHYGALLDKIDSIMHSEGTPESVVKYLKDYSRRMTGELSEFDKSMNITIQDFAGKIRSMPKFGEAWYQALTNGNPSGRAAYNLTSALYVMWLGFKATSAIRNLSQHTLIIGEVGIEHFSKGIGLRFTKEGREVLKKSLVWRSRQFAFVEGLDSSFQSRFQKDFAEKALYLFRKADEQNVKDAFLAGYAEAKELLPDANPQVWYDRGDEVAADTQYLYTKMNSPSWAHDSKGRVLSMLTTWTINWMDLMSKWVSKRPSQVYLEQERLTGKKVSQANWSTSYKAIGLYMLIVGLAYVIKERTRLKAWEYTGITSLNYLAAIMGGEFPALTLPGAVADVVAGTLFNDDRRMKTGLNQLKNMVGIINQLDDVSKGEKDWLTLLFYLEGKDIETKRLKEKWEKDFKPYEDLSDPEIRAKQYPTLSRPQAQKKWRVDNPREEAKMFVVGNFSVLSTDEARTEVLRLIQEHNLDPDLIDGYDKVFGGDVSETLGKFKKRIGNLEKLQIGEEADYFTVGNYITELNKAVKLHGRAMVEKNGTPFAQEILRAQDAFGQYEEQEVDGRKLFRQLFPDVEALLYLTGKVQAFENPKSAEILLGLMKKYDIPPEGIRAFIEKPERYDELFTQKFELEKNNFELDTEYENFGNSESPIYIEDEEVRKEAREKLKEDNPNWVADMRRIEAIDNDASPEIIEKWAERGKRVDQFSANSPQVKFYMLENQDALDWALEKELLTDDLSDESIDALRIRVDNQNLTDKYEALSDEFEDKKDPITGINPRDEAQKKFKAKNLKWVDDMRRVEMHEYSVDYPEATGLVEEFVEYGKTVDEFSALSAEAMLYRYEHKGLETFGTKQSPDGESLTLWENGVDESRVPIWTIDRQYRKEDDEYQAILDKYEGAEETKATNAYLYKNGQPTEYALKRYERDALDKDFPMVKEYVEWHTNPKLKRPEGLDAPWYEDDWYLIEHEGFHRALVKAGIFKKFRDLGGVPSREIYGFYTEYLRKSSSASRLTYRWKLWEDGIDKLENWMLATNKVTEHVKDKGEKQEITGIERLEEAREKRSTEFWEKLEKYKQGR